MRSGGVPPLKRGCSVDWIFWVDGELDLAVRLREGLVVLALCVLGVLVAESAVEDDDIEAGASH